MEQNKDLKDRYDKIYLRGYEKYATNDGLEESKNIISMMTDWRGLDVLEIGCGEGRLSAMLALEGARIEAVDYSEYAIIKAKQNYTIENLVFLTADYRDIGKECDVVVMQGVLEHLTNPYEELKHILDTNVKEHGCLITSSPNFMNVRGIVWMTFQLLFDIKMSMNDLHEIYPWDMIMFCKKNNYKLDVRTCNDDWGNSKGCIADFNRRFKSLTFLPLVEQVTGQKWDRDKIDKFLNTLGLSTQYIQNQSPLRGANIIYKITKDNA